ncbi:MAG: hypothetical protein NC095_00365 [Muribaculum sp.]|nr:hypothetical protein [Muribaculum sp.]
MIKRYEVRGMMEWHPMFAVGRARIQVSFTGGHLGEGCSTPAAYITSDPVVQRVIEHSEAFLNHRIRVAACYPDTSDKNVVPKNKKAVKAAAASPFATSVKKAVSENNSEDMEIMEFDDYEDAADFLHYKKNIPVDQLLDWESCVVEANRQGIKLVLKDEKI